MRFIPKEEIEQEGYGAYAALFAEDADRAQPATGRTELATFGMGCFWGAEADFCVIDGVVETRVGYAGGRTENPDYRGVSSGRTGHAERDSDPRGDCLLSG